MGQKRTQNIIDEKIGVYLAEFETEVLAKIRRQLDGQVGERMDTLIEKEDRFARDTQQLSELARDLTRIHTHFGQHVTMYIIGLSLVSSMIGGVITFLLVWFFW